ncbi:uncharacterized protein LOC144284441 [Canis aureus]
MLHHNAYVTHLASISHTGILSSHITTRRRGDPEAAGAMFMFMIPPRPLCRILHPQNNRLPDILTLTSYRKQIWEELGKQDVFQEYPLPKA